VVVGGYELMDEASMGDILRTILLLIAGIFWLSAIYIMAHFVMKYW
jgi:hypothetical protein